MATVAAIARALERESGWLRLLIGPGKASGLVGRLNELEERRRRQAETHRAEVQTGPAYDPRRTP